MSPSERRASKRPVQLRGTCSPDDRFGNHWWWPPPKPGDPCLCGEVAWVPVDPKVTSGAPDTVELKP